MRFRTPPQRGRGGPGLGATADAPLTRILVRDQGKIFPLQVDAIECLRSDNKYTAITSKGRSYLVRVPIAGFEARLDPRASSSCSAAASSTSTSWTA